MARTPKIHASRNPPRLHFIPEWAAKRNIRQVDIVEELGVDKGTVSKWFSGKAFPTQENFFALAALFELEEPNRIFSHPDDDWLKRLFDHRSAEERERIIRTIEAAFPEPAAPSTGKKVA